jgi:hypothetical protein
MAMRDGNKEGKSIPIKYVIPKEGTDPWVDVFVIPKKAEHKEAAEKFYVHTRVGPGEERDAQRFGSGCPARVQICDRDHVAIVALARVPDADQVSWSVSLGQKCSCRPNRFDQVLRTE